MKRNTTSKAGILSRLRKNQPPLSPLPRIEKSPKDTGNRPDDFIKRLESVGSTCLVLDKGQNLATLLAGRFPDEQYIASTAEGVAGTVDLDAIKDPAELEQIGLAVLPAQLGVAENGAIWLTEKDCKHRVLPFITQHLALVLSKENIVANMHQAYDSIHIADTGFGVFIAGPSKTADIEQSLVIGAQGPRSLTVILK